MADSYEAEQMPGVGTVLMRHKVTSPRWIMGLMSGVPLGVGSVVAVGLAIGGFVWSALGAFAGGLALAALFTAIHVTFASARIAVSEGELHVQLGLAGPRIPIASIRGVHVGPSGRNKSGMGVSKDLRGKTWYTLWGDNAHAVHVEHEGGTLILVVKEYRAIADAIEKALAKHRGHRTKVRVDLGDAEIDEAIEHRDSEPVAQRRERA